MKTTDRIKVLILSAGEGTNARPLSAYLPKALFPIANCTLLRSILLQLHSQGFRSATVALPRSAGGVLDMVLAQSPEGFELTPRVAEKPSRGNADTARQLAGADSSPMLVIYGDSFISADFRSLVEAHTRFREKAGLATILYHRPADLLEPGLDGRTYHGVMSVEPDGRVTRFVEKPKVDEMCPGFDLANAAVFVIERQLLEVRRAADFSYHIFEPLDKRENCLYGLSIGGGFRFDVGNLSRYYELNMCCVRKELPLPGSDRQKQPTAGAGQEQTRATIHAPILVGNGAVLCDGAVVGPEVVVGSGCVVERGARVTRSVLMDGCHIGKGSELDGCIVGPGTSISPNAKLARLVCMARPEDTVELAEPSDITGNVHTEDHRPIS